MCITDLRNFVDFCVNLRTPVLKFNRFHNLYPKQERTRLSYKYWDEYLGSVEKLPDSLFQFCFAVEVCLHILKQHIHAAYLYWEKYENVSNNLNIFCH